MQKSCWSAEEKVCTQIKKHHDNSKCAIDYRMSQKKAKSIDYFHVKPATYR